MNRTTLIVLLAVGVGLYFYFRGGKAFALPLTSTGGAFPVPGANNVSGSGIFFIEGAEGFSPRPYTDTDGALHIGYGHKIGAGDGLSASSVLTQAQADALLRRDLASVYVPAVRSAVKVPLSQGQFDALTSLCYNIGPGNFAGSQVVKSLNAGDTHGALQAFNNWTKAGGNPTALASRRSAEQQLFATA